QERNARHAITGVLLFNGKHFIQAIEGDDIDIDYLMSLILSDPRHHHVSVLSEETIAAREFSDWSMQLVRFQSRDDIHHSFLQRLPQGARDALVTIA
ncbi:MAG: BLUF domain-containing protein, partial [Beijerinckiaceae bacterium]